jgi:hypothetical protein
MGRLALCHMVIATHRFTSLPSFGLNTTTTVYLYIYYYNSTQPATDVRRRNTDVLRRNPDVRRRNTDVRRRNPNARRRDQRSYSVSDLQLQLLWDLGKPQPLPQGSLLKAADFDAHQLRDTGPGFF